MAFFKSVAFPLSLSLGLHAAATAYFYLIPMAHEPAEEATIAVDFVPPKAESAAKADALPAKKKIRGIPVPKYRNPIPIPAASEPPPKDLERKLDLEKTMAEQKAVPLGAEVKSAAEILADPVKGKVYVGYFGAIRDKIHKTLSDKYANRYSGRGNVALNFVLDGAGKIERITVREGQSSADDVLKQLAIQCLRESGPFGVFPRELGSQPIAFSVTIFFDGS